MNAITEILCRYDAAHNIGVVFIRSAMDDNNIMAWTGGKETQLTTVQYYKDTKPLSAADEEVLRKNYAAAMNDPNVRVRHRLPRTEKFRANLLAQPSALPSPVAILPVPTPVPVASPPVADVIPTEAPQSAPAVAVLPAPIKAKRSRKPVAKKATKKTATRRPAAKPISDVLPVASPEVPAPIDAHEILRKMQEQFNAQFAALASTLTTA